MTDPGTGAGGASGRRVWPLVVAALVVVGLLIGGGVALVANDPADPSSSSSASTTASPVPPPVDQAQLAGRYRVTLVIRGATNLAVLAGVDHPVPGLRRTTSWRFFPTCAADTAPCDASWEGRRPPLSLSGSTWSATILGPPAPCLDGGHITAPIGMRLVAQDAVATDDGWVVRSFVGTSSIAFRCPGFAPSHGVVDVSGYRI